MSERKKQMKQMCCIYMEMCDVGMHAWRLACGVSKIFSFVSFLFGSLALFFSSLSACH
jgi:hypothetical protein